MAGRSPQVRAHRDTDRSTTRCARHTARRSSIRDPPARIPPDRHGHGEQSCEHWPAAGRAYLRRSHSRHRPCLDARFAPLRLISHRIGALRAIPNSGHDPTGSNRHKGARVAFKPLAAAPGSMTVMDLLLGSRPSRPLTTAARLSFIGVRLGHLSSFVEEAVGIDRQSGDAAARRTDRPVANRWRHRRRAEDPDQPRAAQRVRPSK